MKCGRRNCNSEALIGHRYCSTTCNPNWKGGRHIDQNGYVTLVVSPDDPFVSMAFLDYGSYMVYEHRYVMAKKLGRPLESWEFVHHRGTLHPIDSRADRGDNREENLELVTQLENLTIKALVAEVERLQKRIVALERPTTDVAV